MSQRNGNQVAARTTGLFGVPSEIGWLPHAWLTFLGFYVMGLFRWSPDSWQLWVSIAGLLIFLPAYYAAFRCTGQAMLRPIALVVVLGALLSPINPGANVFFQYAAFFAGMATTPTRATLIVAGICTIIIVETLLFKLPQYFWVPGIVVCLGLLGIAINVRQQELANRALRRSRDEVERLAQLAERERIARDLHDVVGHTLSLITLKAQLAGKLVRDDPQACAREIDDIEQTSRNALADVRATVSGYRNVGLPDELQAARLALAAANVSFESEIDTLALAPRQETLVAMLVREAVTNVIRHADASRCRIALRRDNDGVVLTVSDDGHGFRGQEGQGLTGMRERLALLDGKLELSGANSGTTLRARMPLWSPA